MAKKQKPKAKPVQGYEYLGESLTVGAPSSENAAEAVAQLNARGAEGWRLVVFTGAIAWFTRET